MLAKHPASYTRINFSCYSPNPSHHSTNGAPLNPSGFRLDPREEAASALSDINFLRGPLIAAQIAQAQHYVWLQKRKNARETHEACNMPLYPDKSHQISN